MSIIKSKSVKKVRRRAAARRAAKDIFPTKIKLSARDSKRLLADLSAPPPPNEALKEAAARYKQRTTQEQS